MDKDVMDPGPAFAARSASATRNPRGRGRGHPRGRGCRSNSVQRNTSTAPNWRERNSHDDQPIGPSRNNESRWPSQSRDNRDNAGVEKHHANTNTRPHPHNQRRGSGNRNYNRNMDDRRNENNRKKYVGFKLLEEISQGDDQDALLKLTERREAFLELIQSNMDRPDMYVLIIDCMAKVCQSSFDELKLNLVRDICNSNFVVTFKNYLSDLPYVESKATNSLYWKSPDTFWVNLTTFFETVINTSPTLALDKCRALVEATSITCLEYLKNRHGYILPEFLETKFKDLRETMNNFEKIKEADKKAGKRSRLEDRETPPENFRELSVMPTREDLMIDRPFLRPNITDGAYRDVEHYLDVQFRLLREDCFGPLRDGLRQYIEDPKKKKYDNIRVFQNVKFVRPYVSQTKIGSFVQIDMKTNRNVKRINWANNKRFIFGALVLFTKDNCKSFLIGTILDRDVNCLAEGLIPVSLMGAEFNERLYNDDEPFTMIESEVYFEPYFHVLRALQDIGFPEHISMKQYIIYVNPEPKHPSYINPNTQYVVRLKEKPMRQRQVAENDRQDQLFDFDESDSGSDSETEMVNLMLGQEEDESEKVKFNVLQEQTWPDQDILQFNESQLEAYKLSLTHEFAVIQGPPGTGKTYLGIKVAKTLFENLKKTQPPIHKGCLMLVICYTNHALDQFLEALLKVTPSIARIGGQSRNTAMDPINLTQLRRKINTHSNAHSVFIEQKVKLREVVSEFQKVMVDLDILLNGVLKMKMLTEIPEINLLNKFYGSRGRDALYQWLFESNADYYVDVQALLLEEDVNNSYAEHEKEKRKRTGVQLDEQESNEKEQKAYRDKIASFSLEETNSKIKELIIKYKECPDLVQKHNFVLEIQYLNSLKDLFNDMSQYRSRRIAVRINERTNFYEFSNVDRWTLYFMWIHREVIEKKTEIGILQRKVTAATTAYEEARMLLDMQVLKDRKIVGMTTSGAARMRKLLQTLAPPIVIVEEAAEVLEQHIITSLTKDCKHLILIGDHQQLRPSAAHMRLAKHYNIEVSLFERMITNGIHSRRLGVQHRMRPEIAALICPHIYRDLQNHPTVHDFPNVQGMMKNLFFMTHDHKEDEVVDNQSRTNHKEADLVLMLANYVMQQGYSEEDVTILTAYKGQMFYMRKESDKYTHLKGVKITVVDNYQGEESKIILLSLVRNNFDNKIGFLGTANRICVALSRAKEGFYIFGNIENLKASSELWQNIATTLEEGGNLGTSITLKCQNHLNNLTEITKLEDFQHVPEGGCKAPCESFLRRCGHKCMLFCHGYDRDHVTNLTKCPKKCERILCELGHVCPKKCADDCGPCKHKVTKKLPCGHEMDVFCYLEPDDESIKCHTKVEVTLPNCGHKAEKLCFVKINTVTCMVQCEYRVEKCGHGCLRKCHVKDDPDHEKYLCRKQCAKANAGCTAGLEGDRGAHQCVKQCWESCSECTVEVQKRRSTCRHTERVACNKSIDEMPCMKKCTKTLPCNHFCKQKCSQICGNCIEMVTKEIPDCKHTIRMQCKMEPTRSLCTQKCQSVMGCGHNCKGMCRDPCDRTLCTELSGRSVAAPCGHQVELPCNMATLTADMIPGTRLSSLCTAPCNAELACKHVCGGTCGACHQGRLHAPCTQTCNQNNICEHQCEEPCNQICPPCKKKCEVRCKHSKCNKQCGAPCTTCKEKCERRCVHLGTCRKRCGEPCSRPACDEPCSRPLDACGHPCRGLCGEPCPPVCKACNPDTFPRDFLGDEYDDNAKFILLQDCGHVMEVEDMDCLMLADSSAIEIKKCPFCRKPIINTGRYKDLVNAIFKKDINPIKTKIYGTPKQIDDKKKELQEKISRFREKYTKVLLADTNIKTVYLNLQSVAKTSKNVSKLQLEMVCICLEILDMIAECCLKYLEEKLTDLRTELHEQTALVCGAFQFRLKAGVVVKVSEQQQYDLRFELQRLNAVVQLSRLTSHESFATSHTPAVRDAYGIARAHVFTLGRFQEDRAMSALNQLQETMKLACVITKQEREMIVAAMGLKAGAWYKCPNGHHYCITECGGAMEESKCPACGEKIGGTNHTLTAGNTHAGEMDGSRFAAWSQEANNMANFDLRNLV